MRRDLLIGVIGTVAFVVAGVVAIVALVTRHRGDIPVAGDAAPILAALVSADGRHVIVSATTPRCHVPSLTAREDEHTVQLTFTSQPYYGPCQLLAGATTVAVDHVSLARPLAARTLLDHSTGRAVRYFDGRALWRVGYLPPGWRIESNVPGPLGNGARGSLTWTRRYVRGLSSMQVVQSDRPLPTYDHSKPVATVRVAGQPVQLHYTSGAYSAGWSSGRMYFTLGVNPTGGGDPAMSTAAVERVLSGLRR